MVSKTMMVPIILFNSSTTLNLQKFHEDSTLVYSIEEDDHDMLTMTAIIGAARIIFTQLQKIIFDNF